MRCHLLRKETSGISGILIALNGTNTGQIAIVPNVESILGVLILHIDQGRGVQTSLIPTISSARIVVVRYRVKEVKER